MSFFNKSISDLVSFVNWWTVTDIAPATSAGSCFFCEPFGRYSLYCMTIATDIASLEIALFQSKPEDGIDPAAFVPIEGAEINYIDINGINSAIINFKDTDLRQKEGYTCIGIMITNTGANSIDFVTTQLLGANGNYEPIEQPLNPVIVTVK